MTQQVRNRTLPSLERVVTKIRDDLSSGNRDVVLIYAHNGVGKTRLSMEFKDYGKRRNAGQADTLYYNAFTEDLFVWNNDLEGDESRFLTLNADSRFFDGLDEFEIETRVREKLAPHVDFQFRVEQRNAEQLESEERPRLEEGRVIFGRDVLVRDGGVERSQLVEGIKVSRGEESQFVWAFFLAILEIALDEDIEAFGDIQYVYIDDPISSLDENNAIAAAVDLAAVLRGGQGRMKVVVSSHHSLFFNVMCNELKHGVKTKRYHIYRPGNGSRYELRPTDHQPFFHHVAMLAEMQRAADTGQLQTYHFNEMRGILERTARFFGYGHFRECLVGMENATRYERAVQLLSHRTFAMFDPVEMGPDNKQLFRELLAAFRDKYDFDVPDFEFPAERSDEAVAVGLGESEADEGVEA